MFYSLSPHKIHTPSCSSALVVAAKQKATYRSHVTAMFCILQERKTVTKVACMFYKDLLPYKISISHAKGH